MGVRIGEVARAGFFFIERLHYNMITASRHAASSRSLKADKLGKAAAWRGALLKNN